MFCWTAILLNSCFVLGLMLLVSRNRIRLAVYVCVCMYIYIYIYIYIHTHSHTHTHTRGNVLQPHISPHKHCTSSHALSIHCSQFPVTVHHNTCIYLLDTLEQCLADGLFCTSYKTLYLWHNYNRSLEMGRLWSEVWRELLWVNVATGHVVVKWPTAGCWCCIRWAICGAECGEICCEARRPLAMWVFPHIFNFIAAYDYCIILHKILINHRLKKPVIFTTLIRL